ncbi:hypothetical protein [Vulcanimicrobium alpinum]|uniref:hypothetical protein n=1 Tax=Vulcanimicrobium alpinum TaxID=3016050 RepID=UPI00295F118E|nr:hypothetical protein [Vulcanimicrobium alpinum]
MRGQLRSAKCPSGLEPDEHYFLRPLNELLGLALDEFAFGIAALLFHRHRRRRFAFDEFAFGVAALFGIDSSGKSEDECEGAGGGNETMHRSRPP